MNRRMLRKAFVALGVVGATVMASLLATGARATPDRNAAAVARFSAVATTAISDRLPSPLGAGHQKLAAGVHVLDLVARDHSGTGPAHLPRIAINLPSGWFNYDGWAMNTGGAGLPGLPLMIVTFWDVNQVYPTPCRWKGKTMVDPGSGVDALASALAKQPLRNAIAARDVVLGGFAGKYLQLSVPRHIDFADCDEGYFETWTALGWGSDRYQQGPGQVDRIWILSVNGQRLVVDAAYMPRATNKDRAELERIVHSIRFLHAEATRTASSFVNGDWIAYATAPADDQSRRSSSGRLLGSDVFIIRAGGRPKLVAGRGSGEIWNVCPAFSPNGRMLAFGRAGPGGQSIVVVGVTRDGRIGSTTVVLRVPGSRARCPKWSSNSSRLAYLDGSGKIIVRGLDGSRPHRADGDPTIHDFSRSKPELLSPTGDLVASLSNGTIVVSRPNLSDRRVIKDDHSYAIAGWSPDGRTLLVMRDVGRLKFTMRAVSVVAPFASTPIAVGVRVNHPRSWPRYGDVSWQPIPRR